MRKQKPKGKAGAAGHHRPAVTATDCRGSRMIEAELSRPVLHLMPVTYEDLPWLLPMACGRIPRNRVDRNRMHRAAAAALRSWLCAEPALATGRQGKGKT